MKKNSLISFIFIVLICALGVGYAVVSSINLNINGTVSTAESAMEVSFEGTTTTAGAGTTTASATKGSLEATITVTGLEAIGDTATATYTIQNSEKDLDASITKKEITNDKEAFFEVTTSVDTTATVIGKTSTGTVTITVRLIKVPIDSADSTANIKVTLQAAPVQPQ